MEGSNASAIYRGGIDVDLVLVEEVNDSMTADLTGLLQGRALQTQLSFLSDVRTPEDEQLH